MRLNNVFTIKQNDTLPAIEAVIRTRGGLDEIIPFNLSGVTACTFSMADDCGNLTISSASAQITCTSGGTVQYNWADGDTVEAGTFSGEFELVFAGGDRMTIPTIGNIGIQIIKNINGS
jgi:hypothetical protein